MTFQDVPFLEFLALGIHRAAIANAVFEPDEAVAVIAEENGEAVAYVVYHDEGDYMHVAYVERLGAEKQGYATEALREVCSRFPDRLILADALHSRSPKLLTNAGFSPPRQSVKRGPAQDVFWRREPLGEASASKET